jgi:hypothetical protein
MVDGRTHWRKVRAEALQLKEGKSSVNRCGDPEKIKDGQKGVEERANYWEW